MYVRVNMSVWFNPRQLVAETGSLQLKGSKRHLHPTRVLAMLYLAYCILLLNLAVGYYRVQLKLARCRGLCSELG